MKTAFIANLQELLNLGAVVITERKTFMFENETIAIEEEKIAINKFVYEMGRDSKYAVIYAYGSLSTKDLTEALESLYIAFGVIEDHT